MSWNIRSKLSLPCVGLIKSIPSPGPQYTESLCGWARRGGPGVVYSALCNGRDSGRRDVSPLTLPTERTAAAIPGSPHFHLTVGGPMICDRQAATESYPTHRGGTDRPPRHPSNVA